MSGGYDKGYRSCSCFWGKEPGSFVVRLVNLVGNLDGRLVLDAGCGEGKNAVYLKSHGADVHAVDISAQAIKNGQRLWESMVQPYWSIVDVRHLMLRPAQYDIIVAYGLLHCLSNEVEVREAITAFKEATVPGGYNVICALNSRVSYFDGAHTDFQPCMLPHSYYIGCYSDWKIIKQSDSDLFETHPHEKIAHTHSVTRLLSRKMPWQ